MQVAASTMHVKLSQYPLVAELKVGESVVVRGRGLGTITSIRDSVIQVEEADLDHGESSHFEIDISRADEALRLVVSSEQATLLLPALREPRRRLPTEKRAIAYHQALKRGDLTEQVHLLAAAYQGEQETPERQYLAKLEKRVYGELALALGISRKALAAKIRSATTGAATPRSLALPDRSAELAAAKLPHLRGYEAIGAFAIDRRIAVGEGAAAVALEATPGVWFAYAHPHGDDYDVLVAVHERSFAQLTSLRSQKVGVAAIEGAKIAIFDEALVDDPEVIDRMMRSGTDIVDDRAAVLALGGDGSAEIHATVVDGYAVHVRANL
jgi:RNA polymerase-interacting CarD/CdnL/TRCF family regulator